jgi:serine/threonine-protein kinase
VLKALRRDPGRRYASAAALADDLRRYLEGRPVQARPDTLTYRAGKFVRRHRLAVAAAVLVTASLLGGLAVATWQARRAAAEARRAERVIELLVGIFDAADPDQSGGRTLTAKEIVQEGLTRIERDLQGEPEVQADLFVALSRIRRSLGEFEGARALAERSVALHGGPDHPEAGDALTALGASLLSLGRFDQALPALEQAIDRLVRAEGPHSLAVARARSVYGNVLYLTGKVHEAEASERAVYAIHRERFGDDDVRTAEHLRNLGVLLVDLERFPEAEDAHRRALRVLEAKLGPDHPQVAFSLYCLGFVAQGQRKYAAAEPLFRRALAVREQVLGPAHPQVGETLHTLALALVAQDKLDEAEQAARRSE